jgi:hypothetical protein
MRSLKICTAHQVLFGRSNREEWDGRGMWHVWGRGEVYTGLWWGNLRPLERTGLSWEDNIKMNIREEGCGGMDWIDLAQDRGWCECGNEPSGSIKCGEFLNELRTG